MMYDHKLWLFSIKYGYFKINSSERSEREKKYLHCFLCICTGPVTALVIFINKSCVPRNERHILRVPYSPPDYRVTAKNDPEYRVPKGGGGSPTVQVSIGSSILKKIDVTVTFT